MCKHGDKSFVLVYLNVLKEFAPNQVYLFVLFAAMGILAQTV